MNVGEGKALTKRTEEEGSPESLFSLKEPPSTATECLSSVVSTVLRIADSVSPTNCIVPSSDEACGISPP